MGHFALNQAILRPDYGWCWVIFASSCLLNFVQSGFCNSFGVLFAHLLKDMGEQEERIAWIGSIALCFNMLGALPAVKLCDKIGIPCTWFAGTLLCSSGFIGTSFAKSKYVMYFTYGILYGFGSSFFYTIIMVLLTLLFKKYQAMTTGLVIASGSVGCLVLAPVLEYSMSNFGIKATLITEGIVFFVAGTLCSMSVIPLARLDKEGAKKAAQIRRQPGGSGGEKVPLLSACHTEAKHKQTELSAESTYTLWKKDQDDVTCVKAGMSTATKKDKFYQKTWRLLKRKEYLLFLAIMVITNFTYYIPLTHLINYAVKFGTSSSKATLLITIWSACHVIGCAAFALIATRYPTKRLLTYQVAMLVSGIASILASVADKYSLLVAYSIVHGFLDGSFSGLQPLVTLHIVGSDEMDRGFGILNCIIAIPCSLGPTVVGWVNDSKILPRRSMFYFAGLPFVAGSILMAPLIKWAPFTASKTRETSESSPPSSGSTDPKV